MREISTGKGLVTNLSLQQTNTAHLSYRVLHKFEENKK
jgi:hypothetical protein